VKKLILLLLAVFSFASLTKEDVREIIKAFHKKVKRKIKKRRKNTSPVINFKKLSNI
jgi:hypothetical protein